MNYSSNMYPNNFGIIHQGVENCFEIFQLNKGRREGKCLENSFPCFSKRKLFIVMKHFDQVMDIISKAFIPGNLFYECFMQQQKG